MNRNQLSTPNQIANFITGGNATFTLESEFTGKHLTFKAQEVPNSDGTRFFVKLLTGPENSSDYMYIGMIVENIVRFPVAGAHAYTHNNLGWKFITTSASHITLDSPAAKALNYVLDAVNRLAMPDRVNVWHEGRCCKCGRKLTVPESIQSGIGPECSRRIQAQHDDLAGMIPVRSFKPDNRPALGGMNND